MATNDKDLAPLVDAEKLQEHISKALELAHPTNSAAWAWYQPLKWVFKPHFSGVDRLSEKPCLFVSNHALFALDGAILTSSMCAELGRFLRPMGDKALFANDKTADFILKRGSIMGHPEVCGALMEAGKDLLVYPGGAHEAVKPADELYSLQWKERYGFVRLAAQHGYTIQPVGMIGPDEFYNHLIEGKDLANSRLGKLLKQYGLIDDQTRSDLLPPIPMGAMGSLLPKPKRCFIGFGEPLDLSEYKDKELSQATLKRLRNKVAHQIEEQIAELLRTREQHKSEDGLLRRLLNV